MALRTISLASVLCIVAACGGRTEQSVGDDGGDSGSSAGDADVLVGDSSAANSPCVSVSGFAVCGGPNDCFPPSPQTMQSACGDCSLSPDFSVTLCLNSAVPNLSSSAFADDGEVYVEDALQGQWDAYPYEVGALFAANGAADRVRYADWYLWSGAPLPVPTSCPTFSDFAICGGDCGTCDAGDFCTGRSPEHPYGVCLPVPTDTTNCDPGHSWACPAGTACAVLQSSADGQSEADAHGVCVTSAACTAIAASLPGGAICHGH
jgi:hypothetical protein